MTRTIRPYRAEDIEPVIDVWQRANASAHPFLSEDFVAEVHRAMRDICLPNMETHLLEVDGTAAGFIALVGNEIGGLFLDPALHGCGHGRALVDHAVALKGPLTVEVFRDNEVGRPFYERHGFEFVEDDARAVRSYLPQDGDAGCVTSEEDGPLPASGAGTPRSEGRCGTCLRPPPPSGMFGQPPR